MANQPPPPKKTSPQHGSRAVPCLEEAHEGEGAGGPVRVEGIGGGPVGIQSLAAEGGEPPPGPRRGGGDSTAEIICLE